MINEWENEPDYLRFTEDTTGLECIISRVKSSGILCGYVVIPKDNKLYGKTYSDPIFDIVKVHGGITFSDNRMYLEDNETRYMIGFDCGHYEDLMPNYPWSHDGTYKNIAYVKYNCIKLAKQLCELSNKSNRDNTMTYNEVLTLLTNIHEWCKDRYKDKYSTCENDDNNYELLWEIESIKDMIVKKENDING